MFEGEALARTASQEHAAAELTRQRSSSASSRNPPFAAVAPSVSRPAPIAETSSNHSTTTLAEPDLEAGAQEKSEKQEAAAPAPAPEDEFLVTLKGREQLNPHTWNTTYRWALTGFAGLLVLNATFASSAPSNLIPSIITHFHVSEEVGILLISIFVAGYCVGPLLWGPLSERYGRRLVFIGSWIPYFCFQIGAALSPNVGSIIVFRFLGVIADLWGPDQRGDALAIFALMPFAGPALAPIISGYMYVTGTNWRWIFWVLTIFAGVCFVAILALLPETYVPYILYKEAKRLRKETGDTRWHAALEGNGAKETASMVLDRTVFKPFRMIVQEPMLAVITLYMSFVYGIVYLLFEAIPIIFVQQHGLNSGEAGLVFLALLFGGVTSVLLYIFYFNPDYKKIHHSLQGRPVPPEVRLKALAYAAPLMPISMLIVAFTSYSNLSIAGPIIGIWLLGGCVLFVFLACFNYIIDCYLMNAASALAINTVVRSSFGAGFPLFAGQMYRKLSTPGATGLLAGLALVFVPMPFLLMKYGKKIRAMSKNAIVRPGE
ncbi:major facilitator superfamily domain-containing protein [Leucosporidium creatinivorum]|uniref:Major facilitator superfamily domain-containing protein n=1 Tax=Leucosporidium creatinivorum TaxID=106004 RepID=A0A1Y2FZL5_9BASI|nr:major facilitator superfamily domain-containing protein [Leucosporidium creatinivorum]